MKTINFLVLMLLFSISTQAQNHSFPKNMEEDRGEIMSEAYWEIWNPEVQKQIDMDIEKYRKADGFLLLTDIDSDSEVQIKQISHDFIFGAHIFNYNQLGKKEYNDRYKELYGTLFNSATVAFYWKTHEMQPNRPRFTEEYWDTEEYWNSVTEPKMEPHWRRPATDPVIEFCEDKNIRIHGHPLIWGNRRWHKPNWLIINKLTPEEKTSLEPIITKYGDLDNFLVGEAYSDEYNNVTREQLEEMLPDYANELKDAYEKRIIDIASYYGDRVHSWDVVNESATDYKNGELLTETALTKSRYGIMPGDLTYNAFQVAQRVFPENVQLNINDFVIDESYAKQTIELMDRGCKIDIIGEQMHLFNPQQSLDIAAGKEIQTPDHVRKWVEHLTKTGLPIHLSEVTITSPGNDTKGRNIQAVIAQNLYRLWFSIEPMMGITWWNVVDDCGAPGEPSISGIFTRDMVAKPAYHALNNLIDNEWKTNLTAKPDKDGYVKFRGFKGNYKITWKDKAGNIQTKEYYLK